MEGTAESKTTSTTTSTSVTSITRRSRQMLTKQSLTSSIDNGLTGASTYPAHPNQSHRLDNGDGDKIGNSIPGATPAAMRSPPGRRTKISESDSESLEKRGIRIVDSKLKNFTNVSPSEVADYYKSLGEWQNVLPKTDYTYSPVSVYYTKKINGVIPIVPNMSRRDIWTSAEDIDNRINSCYARTYSSTKTIRSRYFNWRWTRSRGQSDTSSSSDNTSRSFGDTLYESSHRIGRNVSSVVSRGLSVLLTCHRYVYSKTIEKLFTRSYTSHTTSSTTKWSSASRSNGHASLVKLMFLFAALALVVYTLSGGNSTATAAPTSTTSSITSWLSDLAGSCGSIFVLPVRKLFASLSSLVVNIVALTYASVIFLLNVVWVAGRSSADAASTIIISPLYETYAQLVHISSDHTRSDETQSRTKGMDAASVEQLFRRLLDANAAHLVQKVVGSPELAELVDGKLKQQRDHEDVKYAELARAFDDRTSALERRVEVLEARIAESSETDERVEELRRRVASLKEEIRTGEKRVGDNLVALLSEMLGVTEPESQSNLKARFAELFASIEQAHFKVDRLSREFWAHTNNASEQLERTKSQLEFDLKSSVDELISRKLDEWKVSASFKSAAAVENSDSLEAYVKEVVRKALEVYDADKTGQVDYALESAGGVVLSTRCTETKTTNAQFSVLGIPLWYTSRSPRTVIQPGVHPGECWAFPGSTGYLVIQLSERIVITGFTLEHIPRSLASNGTIDSAPKDFAVWALRYETDQEPKFLGQFRFDEEGPSLQYYDAIRLDEPYQIVELKILSNHGKMDYTCLYRFRVHGIPV